MKEDLIELFEAKGVKYDEKTLDALLPLLDKSKLRDLKIKTVYYQYLSMVNKDGKKYSCAEAKELCAIKLNKTISNVRVAVYRKPFGGVWD